MKHSRSPTGIAGPELKRLLARLCEHSQQDVTRMSRHEEVAVHQLRVRMKKLSALLRLAEEGIDEHSLEAMRLHVKAVKNACAASRDEVVRDKLIDKLVHRHHLHVRPQALARRTTAQEGPPPAFLRHQLHALEELIGRTPIDALSDEELAAQHARCYRKGRRLLKEAAESSDDTTMHRWRHRVKDFYFQTLLFSRSAGARSRLRRARRLGALLGRDHDFAALAHEPVFRSRRSPWPDIIRENREALRQRCLGIGHKLYRAHSSRLRESLLCAG